MVETRKEHIARKPPRDSDPISFLFAHFLPMSNGPVLHTQSRAGQSSACTLIQWYNFPLYLRIVHFIYIEQVKQRARPAKTLHQYLAICGPQTYLL